MVGRETGADLGEILTVFQNERRRRKLLGGSEACTPWICFTIFFYLFILFSPQSRFSWVSESFSQDIGRILTWKVFFHENLFIYENSDRFS